MARWSPVNHVSGIGFHIPTELPFGSRIFRSTILLDMSWHDGLQFRVSVTCCLYHPAYHYLLTATGYLTYLQLFDAA
jgi:hypothetical protein